MVDKKERPTLYDLNQIVSEIRTHLIGYKLTTEEYNYVVGKLQE